MATAAVEICNLALIRVGVKHLIEDLDEGSAVADVCQALYATQRDIALQSWWWKWATGRSDLAQLVIDDRDDWAYAYTLPSDLIQPRYIWSGARTTDVETEIPYSIEADETGAYSILLTDHDAPTLIYTRRVVNVPSYPPMFVNALAWLLAAELVLALPLRPELENGARTRFEQEVSKARALDMNSGHETPLKSRYVRVRG